MTSKIKVDLILMPTEDSLPCKVTINNEVIFNDQLTAPQTISGEIGQTETLNIKIESNS